MFSISDWAEGDTLLVTSVDSVGTKVMVASMMNRHHTVGQDLVNHCANDILVQGARPLFFMDYIAADRLPPELVVALIEGLAKACKAIGCALIGGEMAELPGVYREGEYDLVGFIGGAVKRERTVSGDRIRPGDVLLGIASDGLHTNGYALARKVCFEVAGLSAQDEMEELGGSIGEELLRVHRCYVSAVRPLLEEFDIKGMAHITGGGLPDNLVRCLPEGCRAQVRAGSWERPPVFKVMQEIGQIVDEEMFHTFNMGVGFVLVVEEGTADAVASSLSAKGERVYRIGEVEAGERAVVIG